ncbi:hypothetical protein [Pseudomonas aeruginosa]
MDVVVLAIALGGYNRCWEIRKTHLPISAWNSLYERFSTKMPIRLPSVLVSLFWCNEHGAVGFRLHNTPWTDECLEILEMTAAALRQEQLAFGLDEHLVDLGAPPRLNSVKPGCPVPVVRPQMGDRLAMC